MNSTDQAGPGGGDRPAPRTVTPPEVGLRTITAVRWGMVVWAIVLVVLLVVPDLRTGDRSWWPWVPVAALGLGLIGIAYLSRGRGNASDA